MRYSIFSTILLVSGCGVFHDVAVAGDISLCELRLNPDVYDGKSINFHANISSDGVERTSLWDPKCKDFALGVDQASGGADWKEVNKIVYGVGNIGTTDKTVSAEMSVVYHNTPRGGKVSVMTISNVSYSMIK